MYPDAPIVYAGAPGPLFAGAWHYLAFSYDGVPSHGLDYVIDGLSAKVSWTERGDLALFDSASSVPFRIGGPSGIYVDEFAFYSRYVSPERFTLRWASF